VASFVGRQLAVLVGMLFVGSFLIFSLVDLAPGDPLAALTGNKVVTQERIDQLTEQYNLDEPFLNRYFLWVQGVFQGDFGVSIVYQSSVNSLLEIALPITVGLVLLSEFFIVLFGVTAAVIAARYKGAPDTIVAFGSSLAISIPVFVTAVFLTIVFGNLLGWFPTIGPGEGGLDTLYHLILPSLALAIGGSALLARIARSSFRDELESPHVITETSRGIDSGRVFRRHVFRNGLPPILAVVAIQIPGLIAGAVVVEQVFNLGGAGSLLLAGINANDFALVQAVGLIILATTISLGIVADIVYGVLDPRVKVGQK
jgi:peptide/nickel transport system permease protein